MESGFLQPEAMAAYVSYSNLVSLLALEGLKESFFNVWLTLKDWFFLIAVRNVEKMHQNTDALSMAVESNAMLKGSVVRICSAEEEGKGSVFWGCVRRIRLFAETVRRSVIGPGGRTTSWGVAPAEYLLSSISNHSIFCSMPERPSASPGRI